MQTSKSDRASNSVLAVRLHGGDDEAARVLVERLSPWLKKVIERRIGPRLKRRVDAEDIMQSALWSFCRRTSDGEYEFEHSGALCRMLMTIAENKIRRAGRHHTQQCRDMRRETILGDLPSGEGMLELSNGESEKTMKDLSDAVDEVAHVVDQLPPRDAEFFRRRYFLDHSTGQISADTGWSHATVKRVLKHAVDEIRRSINNNFQ